MEESGLKIYLERAVKIMGGALTFIFAYLAYSTIERNGFDPYAVIFLFFTFSSWYLIKLLILRPIFCKSEEPNSLLFEKNDDEDDG